MVRAWDPYDRPDRERKTIEDFLQINETRAQCVKFLREEFGDKFYGGCSHTEHAVKNYKECLMPDNTLSSQRNYIRLLRSYPICVATTGLHGSIGFKFAEYVASSKAILSEKLNYEVPGGLEAGNNYIEFDFPEDCVNKARQLFSDSGLRRQIMKNNAIYYR